jgi:putative phosphoesterase
MLKIAVISDTHTTSLAELPAELRDILSDADIILHAGDYTSDYLLNELRDLGQFNGVSGNMDPYQIKRSLPPSLTLEFSGFKIGMTHPIEGGTPFNIEKKVRSRFDKVDILIFGHTHKTKNKKVGDVLMINPGSAIGAFPATRKTMCVILIDDTIEARIQVL